MNDLTIFERGGKVLVNSRDVATKTGKRHADILRDIDNLLKNNADADLRWLIEAPYIDEQGKERRSVDMTKDGFTLLSMGWTGPKWVNAKIKWIKQFNLMEDELERIAQHGPAAAPLNREELFRLAYLENIKVVEEQKKVIEDLTPDAIAHRRLAASEGSMCIREAAKKLDCAERKLANWMHSIGYIYKNDKQGPWLGYDKHTKNGDLEHVSYTKFDRQGREFEVTQVRITVQGFAKLAKLLPEDLRFRNRHADKGEHDLPTIN